MAIGQAATSAPTIRWLAVTIGGLFLTPPPATASRSDS